MTPHSSIDRDTYTNTVWNDSPVGHTTQQRKFGYGKPTRRFVLTNASPITETYLRKTVPTLFIHTPDVFAQFPPLRDSPDTSFMSPSACSFGDALSGETVHRSLAQICVPRIACHKLWFLWHRRVDGRQDRGRL